MCPLKGILAPAAPLQAPLIFMAAGWGLTRERLKFPGKNVNKGPCPACPPYLRNPERAGPFSQPYFIPAIPAGCEPKRQ